MPDPRDAHALFRSVPVVPVVVVDDPALAAPLTRALYEAGLTLVEITLRTPSALEALRRAAAETPEAHVGAGSVRTPADVAAVLAAGARFIVSPGQTPALLDAFRDAPVPCLPGAATASEAMAAVEKGFTALKFFPAEASGGVATLKALAGPLPDLAFCPTGGIDVQRAATYLGLRNVMTVGGSWITPPDLVAAGAFDRIAALARAAMALENARPRPA